MLDDRTIRARSLAADAYGFGWEAIGATPGYSRLELGLGLRLRTIDGLIWDVSATAWTRSEASAVVGTRLEPVFQF